MTDWAECNGERKHRLLLRRHFFVIGDRAVRLLDVYLDNEIKNGLPTKANLFRDVKENIPFYLNKRNVKDNEVTFIEIFTAQYSHEQYENKYSNII